MVLTPFSKSVQSRRDYQEDRYVNAKLGKDMYLSCVFDGHGGSAVSEFCANNIEKLFQQELKNGSYDLPILIRRVLNSLEQLVYALNVPHIGSTVVLCLVTKNKIFFANIGDSMSMIKFKGLPPISSSYEHKPTQHFERQRIIDAGGFITEQYGIARVNGNLNLSRSIGDFYMKKFIISEPFIKSFDNINVEYIFLASDGIWDVLDKNDINNIVASSKKHQDYIENIVETALLRGSGDNITGTIILSLK